MILDEKEVTERMSSPMNLLNRLRSASNTKQIDQNGNPANIIPSLPPTSKDIIDNLEEKLAYGSIKSKAAGIMIAAMDELKSRLPETSKPEQLARIAESMSKVVNAENANNKNDSINKPVFIIYSPQFNNENHYETIYARE
jgi:hypothetical protein